MQKILIISYFFPPCNLTASLRVSSWANHFYKFGLYPVIITRNWDHEVRSEEDIIRPGGSRIFHKKTEQYEVFYLPHKGSVRDKLYAQLHDTPLAGITKPLTLLELVGKNYLNACTPFVYLKDFARKLLRRDKDLEYLLISANPFSLFKFGYELKKEFPNIRWIADYRDDWTTSETTDSSRLLKKEIKKLDKNIERKWLSNAEFITSISPHYTQKISRFVGKAGFTVYNGYDFMPRRTENRLGCFVITYNGTLYPTQNIEDVLYCIKRLIEQNPDIPVKIRFPGLGFDKTQAARVRNYMKGYEANLEIYERMPRPKVLKMQQDSHILLMIAHKNRKGITSSKLFEYISLRRPIVIYGNDHDVLEQIIHETQTGIIAETMPHLAEELALRITEFRQTGDVSINPDLNAIQKYSREQQAYNLCQYILESDNVLKAASAPSEKLTKINSDSHSNNRPNTAA